MIYFEEPYFTILQLAWYYESINQDTMGYFIHESEIASMNKNVNIYEKLGSNSVL